MDARTPAVALLAVVLGCGAEQEPPASISRLAPETVIPARWHPSPAASRSPVFILWVFRTEDCLSCQALDYEFRRVQRTYGRSIPVVAVHVGRVEDERVAETFLSTRRVRAELVTVAPSRYRRMFGDLLPSVHVVRGGRIAWSALIFNDSTLLAPRLDSALASMSAVPALRGAARPVEFE